MSEPPRKRAEPAPAAAPTRRVAGRMPRELRPLNPLLVYGFRLIARRRIRRAFRALRLARKERLAGLDAKTPLIFYLNHPSWWDPLAAFVLAPHLARRRSFFGPMEASSLQRYRVFSKIGMFPVELDKPRGAAQFLRGADFVLNRGDVLAVTAQGGFTDVRVQPPGLKPGVAALLARYERAGRRITAIPLALEYTFWDQRLPEALACIGEPIVVNGPSVMSGPSVANEPPAAGIVAGRTQDWAAALEDRLASTQEELAGLAMTRDGSHFTTILEGRRGTAGLYGSWQRLQLALHRGSVTEDDHAARSRGGWPPPGR